MEPLASSYPAKCKAMADAIAAPDFALGDSNIGEFIIDLAAADSAVEPGPFVGVSMVDDCVAGSISVSLRHPSPKY